MSENGNSNDTHESTQGTTVNTEELIARLERLEAERDAAVKTKEKILEEKRVETYNKQQVMAKLEKIEQERLEKEGNHKELLELEKVERKKVEERLQEMRNRAVETNIVSAVQKLAPNCQDPSLFISLPGVADAIELSEDDSPTQESIERAIKVGQEKYHWYFSKNDRPGMVQEKPGSLKTPSKTVNNMNDDEKRSALREHIRTSLIN